MKCPRCGFEQPDDLFCASCGVDISRYQRRKRWKNTLFGIVISGLILAAGITFFLLRSPTRAPEPEATITRTLPQKSLPKEGKAFRKPRQIRRPRQWDKSRQMKRPRSSRRPKPVPSLPELTEEKEQQKPDQDSLEETKGMSAIDWFNEGVKLSNDSPEEINCYQQALKLDPTLAVAYYNLGLIYHSQKNDELAITQFRNFLRYASDSEIKELPVENYYPLEKIAETSEGTEKAGVAEGETEEKAEEIKAEEKFEEEVESKEGEEAAEEAETESEGETAEEETE
jgi:tetratricopeptide (TPR) repeat protein